MMPFFLMGRRFCSSVARFTANHQNFDGSRCAQSQLRDISTMVCQFRSARPFSSCQSGGAGIMSMLWRSNSVPTFPLISLGSKSVCTAPGLTPTCVRNLATPLSSEVVRFLSGNIICLRVLRSTKNRPWVIPPIAVHGP